jgi:hypothetical protein
VNSTFLSIAATADSAPIRLLSSRRHQSWPRSLLCRHQLRRQLWHRSGSDPTVARADARARVRPSPRVSPVPMESPTDILTSSSAFSVILLYQYGAQDGQRP